MAQNRHSLTLVGSRWCNRGELDRLRRDAASDGPEANRVVLLAEMRCRDFQSDVGKALGERMLTARSKGGGAYAIEIYPSLRRNFDERGWKQRQWLKKHITPMIQDIGVVHARWEIWPKTLADGFTTVTDDWQITIRGPVSKAEKLKEYHALLQHLKFLGGGDENWEGVRYKGWRFSTRKTRYDAWVEAWYYE